MSSEIKDKYSNMLEPFETLGYWWIPGANDKKYSGTLKYDPHESILQVKIIGDMLALKSGPIAIQNVKIVNGLTVGGQYVTLLNCLYIPDQIRMPGYATHRIEPQFVFVGAHFESEADLLFDEAIYSCHNNEQLLGESGFKAEFKLGGDRLSSYNLAYQHPERISFQIDAYKVTSTWGATFPSHGPDLHISERAGFTIESYGHVPHTSFLNDPASKIMFLYSDGKKAICPCPI